MDIGKYLADHFDVLVSDHFSNLRFLDNLNQMVEKWLRVKSVDLEKFSDLVIKTMAGLRLQKIQTDIGDVWCSRVAFFLKRS